MDDGTLTVTIIAPNMVEIIDSLLEANTNGIDITEESSRIYESLLESLQNGNFTTVETIVTVEYIGNNENVELVLSYELADAFYGGMLTKLDEIMTLRD